MSRRDREAAAQQAAQAASEAARVLQQRQQESMKEKAAAAPEPEAAKPEVEPRRIEPRNERRRLAEEEVVARHRAGMGHGEMPREEPIPDNPPPPTMEQMLHGTPHSQPDPEPV